MVVHSLARARCCHDSSGSLSRWRKWAFTILLRLFDVNLQLTLPCLSLDVIGLEKETVFFRMLVGEQILFRTCFVIQDQWIDAAGYVVDALFDLLQRAQMVCGLLLILSLIVILSQQIHLHTRVKALDNLLILCQDATSRELG